MSAWVQWLVIGWSALMVVFLSIGGFFMFRKFLFSMPRVDGPSVLERRRALIEQSLPLWTDEGKRLLNALVAPVPSLFRAAAKEAIAAKILPPGISYEWTDMSYQEKNAGNTAIFVFPLSVLFVFLVLAANYESWAMPMAIILIVPMCLLSAIGGIMMRGMDNNILTQIGFIVLIALAAKNAILIVEFARDLEAQGRSMVEAAVEAARLRLRPILMTSLAFILGVVPLVLAKGAGAEMRQSLGTAVFFGMLGVTLFGLLFTPVFYVLIRRLTERRSRRSQKSTPLVTEPAE